MTDRRAIRYLSLAAKAGKLVTGGDECEKTLRRGRGGLLILAADAAANAERRAASMADGIHVRLMRAPYTKSELAAAVGRARPVAIALVTDEGLASAFADATANGT